jgi:hypothetical protein
VDQKPWHACLRKKTIKTALKHDYDISFHAMISNRRNEAKSVSSALYLISSAGLPKLEMNPLRS